MSIIGPKGSPNAPIWIICERPLSTDKARGYLFSGGMGYVFTKMLEDVGINDYHIVCRCPDLEYPDSYNTQQSELNHYKPPIVIALEETAQHFCKELVPYKGSVENHQGSLLKSDLLFYPHYLIPMHGPEYVAQNWEERDVICSVDLGKALSELQYFRKNGTLEPLPERKLVYDFDLPGGFEKLLKYLDRFQTAKILSNDIETVYPRTQSPLYPHPGLPVCIGLADSKEEGISFRLFREDKSECRELFKRLLHLFLQTRQLGQNFFHYDSFRFEALGFNLSEIVDTYIRHHILWPELPHSLQFMTRQYTRQPYYKDEGAGWSPKNLDNLYRYNCLDVCLTYEIYEAQEKEFDERPYLR